MVSRTAIRTCLRWGGAALCVVLGTAWIGSGFYSPYFKLGDVWVMLDAGCVKLTWETSASGTNWWPPAGPIGWTVLHPAYSWSYYSAQYGLRDYRFVPVWFALAPAALVTLWAWWKEMIARRGRWSVECWKCGYDIRGLRGGSPCPECGQMGASVKGGGEG